MDARLPQGIANLRRDRDVQESSSGNAIGRRLRVRDRCATGGGNSRERGRGYQEYFADSPSCGELTTWRSSIRPERPESAIHRLTNLQHCPHVRTSRALRVPCSRILSNVDALARAHDDVLW